MTYVYERPAPDWICPTCGEGPDRCQMVSEGEMMYPPLLVVERGYERFESSPAGLVLADSWREVNGVRTENPCKPSGTGALPDASQGLNEAPVKPNAVHSIMRDVQGGFT